MEESLPPEKRRGPGLLVFKIENDEIKKIWESSEEIFLDIPRIEVRDITGDGNNEILAFWSDGKVEGLDIYSWTGTTFQYITPQEELTSPDGVTRLVPGFGSYDGGIAVKDLDGDKIEEVIIIETKSIGINPETDESIDEYYRKIYKWNTEKKEYYLWKEEKIGEEKPEP